MTMPLDYMITYAFDPNPYHDTNLNEFPSTYNESFIKYNLSDSQICLSDELVSSPYDDKESLPLYPYIFNPDIYQPSPLNIPRNIVQPTNNKLELNSKIVNLMPHWNYYKFKPSEQEKFISKNFPERIKLYHHYKHYEQRHNLFIYLWLYVNGGLYISPNYEVIKPLDDILDSSNIADLYFMFDHERYISSNFFASQPFCGFWLDVVNLMESRKNNHYSQLQDQIDLTTGRVLLTDVINETHYKYEILPRSLLDPYTPCDTTYDKDSYLKPISNNINFMTYMKCQTGSTDELLYITAAIIFVIIIMFIIAIITK